MNEGFYSELSGPPQAFFFEIAKGNVPGHASRNVIGRNPQVSTSPEDIWDPGGILVYPTAGEQWEILSTSANDTLAGTGARTVELAYQDDFYKRKTTTVSLNGTTPVSFTPTDSFRFEDLKVTVADPANGNKNDGDLTVRVAGGGAVRGGMLAGENIALDGHYTVPAGITAHIVSIFQEINKNEDVVLSYLATNGTNGIFLAGIKSSIYQDSAHFPFSLAALKLEEKSDFKIMAVSSNLIASPLVMTQIIEVDNV